MIRARTEENVTVVDKMVLSQEDRPRIIHRLALQRIQPAIVRIIFHHVLVTWFEEMPAEAPTEEIRHKNSGG